ncbi:Spore germination protein A3 precursor [compost metagenome]
MNISKDRRIVEKLLSEQLREKIERMLARVQKEMKSDIFGLGEEIHIEHPYAWKKMKSSWSDLFPEMPVTIVVDAQIEQMGKTQGHAPLQK